MTHPDDRHDDEPLPATTDSGEARIVVAPPVGTVGVPATGMGAVGPGLGMGPIVATPLAVDADTAEVLDGAPAEPKDDPTFVAANDNTQPAVDRPLAE